MSPSSYKLSIDACLTFLSALPESMDTQLSWLDVRIGLEPIIDDPRFRGAMNRRWQNHKNEELGPDELLMTFTTHSPRHAKLTLENIQEGLRKILDTDEFIGTCNDRWARRDQEDPVDLGAMPTEPDEPTPNDVAPEVFEFPPMADEPPVEGLTEEPKGNQGQGNQGGRGNRANAEEAA